MVGSDGAPARILVVDDSEDNRVLLRGMLEARGATVDEAGDGDAGLLAVRARRPDLVLLDLHMPGLDGFGMLEAQKADPALRDLPVIILTASYREATSVERGLQLGADEYLTKPIDPEELFVRVRSVIRAHRLERELRQLRHDTASMLVHDLRSPMEGVAIALNVLLQQDLPASDARQLIVLARDQVREVSRMVDGLLEAHTAEARLLDLAEVDPGDVVAEVVDEVRLVAEQKGLSLAAEVRPALPPVQADRRLLKRVLANLVGNAVKFTGQGGVTVRVVRSDGDALRVEVTDTGPGIPVDERALIFDRHATIARNASTPERGFGLGLAFCKATIEDHGGAIGVDSAPGCGSTFWVELPLSLPAKAPV